MKPAENVICVDLDGVIATFEEDYSQCKVVTGAREALTGLREMGYVIWIHTGRHLNHWRLTVDWLDENGISYDSLIMGKPPAIAYIDDHAIRFESWTQVLAEGW